MAKQTNQSFLDQIGVNKAYLRTVTAFKRLNRWIVRVSKNTRKPGQIHPNVARTNADFKGARKFCAVFSRAMADYPAWIAAAALYWQGRTGDNFMFHLNHDKLVGRVVGCFHLFRFSFGQRSLPWNLEASAEGHVATITWQDNRVTPHCSPNDPLLVGLIFENRPGSPMLIADTGVTRASCGITIELPTTRPQKAHLYPFFCNPERTEFSESQHLGVQLEIENETFPLTPASDKVF